MLYRYVGLLTLMGDRIPAFQSTQLSSITFDLATPWNYWQRILSVAGDRLQSFSDRALSVRRLESIMSICPNVTRLHANGFEEANGGVTRIADMTRLQHLIIDMHDIAPIDHTIWGQLKSLKLLESLTIYHNIIDYTPQHVRLSIAANGSPKAAHDDHSNDGVYRRVLDHTQPIDWLVRYLARFSLTRVNGMMVAQWLQQQSFVR
jgi:hypothetical protein